MSRRRYRPGRRLQTVEDLISVAKAGIPVYLNGSTDSPKAWAFVQNMSVRTLVGAVARGAFMAVKVWLP